MLINFYSKWIWTKDLDNSLYNTMVFIRKYDRNISLAAFSNSSRIRALNFYKL